MYVMSVRSTVCGLWKWPDHTGTPSGKMSGDTPAPRQTSVLASRQFSGIKESSETGNLLSEKIVHPKNGMQVFMATLRSLRCSSRHLVLTNTI